MHNKLQEYLKSVRNFSGSVLVACKGEIILKEGYGFEDKNKGIKNTPETNYGIGSITKSMTALCTTQLVEKNLLKPTDRIVDFLSGINNWDGITVHNLLNQTSGIPNHIYFKEMQTGDDFTPTEIINFIRKKPLKFKPGRKWSYSNTNYLILAQIIERVTGKGYHEYVTESILKPIGMNNTYFDGEKTDKLAEHGTTVFNCKPSLLFGAGDVVSNIEDLYLYDQALYGEELASRESIKRMQEASNNLGFIKYGYGWFIKSHYGHNSVSHGGFHPIGYTSHLERYLDDKLTIIVLSNGLDKYSRFGMKYFGSTDVGRELAARFYGCKARPWHKFT